MDCTGAPVSCRLRAETGAPVQSSPGKPSSPWAIRGELKAAAAAGERCMHRCPAKRWEGVIIGHSSIHCRMLKHARSPQPVSSRSFALELSKDTSRCPSGVGRARSSRSVTTARVGAARGVKAASAAAASGSTGGFCTARASSVAQAAWTRPEMYRRSAAIFASRLCPSGTLIETCCSAPAASSRRVWVACAWGSSMGSFGSRGLAG